MVTRNDERYLLQALQFEGDLRACLGRYTRSDADIDELLQETYARLLTAAAPTEPDVPSVRAFALATARNIAFDWLRAREGVPAGLTADLTEAPPDTDRAIDRSRELQILAEAIQDLPQRCRQVFTLRKVYGYTQKEVAARLDLSEQAVEQHLTRAARRCAQAVFEESTGEQRATPLERLRRKITGE